MFESAKGPSSNLLTKTIGNMATPEFDFATDYGNSFKNSKSITYLVVSLMKTLV